MYVHYRHSAPGGSPDHRTANVHVLSTLHKIRNTAARAQPGSTHAQRLGTNDTARATGTINPAKATGDAGWSLQVGSSPQFPDLATHGRIDPHIQQKNRITPRVQGSPLAYQ
jgi:hypothetical protein